MSGAPIGTTFELELNGQLQQLTIEPKTMSQLCLNRLRQLILKRRREARQQLIQDMQTIGQNLPDAAQSGFARSLLESVERDTKIGQTEALALLGQSDTEAMGIVLWTCCPELTTFEQAKAVVAAHPNLMELTGLISKVMLEEAKSLKNFDPQLEMEPDSIAERLPLE